MTKSKLINKDGKIIRANLHPSKAETIEGRTYRSRVLAFASRGYTEMKWRK